MSIRSKVMTDNSISIVDKELRASHAGETGAVWIYRGALTADFLVSIVTGLWAKLSSPIQSRKQKEEQKRNHSVSSFASEHLVTEKNHLDIFENHMPPFRGSYMLLLWMVAGFITGFLPRVLGRNWFFYTIYCVEYFVDEHYEAQCRLLESVETAPFDVLEKCRQCQLDEQSHRDEAYNAMTTPPTHAMKLWGKMVGKGSAIAVVVAKKI
ncbi:demethoxyubiquinone hydroxylase family protein [Alteromonas sp. A081]|uniref:demethoxyubiquinone hydroxylase family protein n=1 Tax=Alteromonas sp. A081 TaxID=3410269 RepID=UPI003B97F597